MLGFVFWMIHFTERNVVDVATRPTHHSSFLGLLLRTAQSGLTLG